MRTKYLFVLICLTGIIATSCNKDEKDPDNKAAQTTPYKAGDILTYSFIVDNDTVVKMKDEVLEYGFTNFPVLMLVHKETLIKEQGWGGIFHPLLRDNLDSVLVIWASQFKLNHVTLQDRAYVARNFLDYIVTNELDVGLFVDVIMNGQGLKLGPVMEVISQATMMDKPSNDYLYRMRYENVSPEALMAELIPTKQEIAIFSIFYHVVMTVKTWIKFADNHGPVANAPMNYMSFVCSNDTVLSNYTGGTSFRSRDYKLSYDVGLWEAKCTYHLEGIYNAQNSTCPGKYVPKCNTISTYVHVKGPDFIVDGSVGYSPAINAGTVDNPVADLNGKVQVTYGDCCCFRKFSILNFKVNAATGYSEVTFDSGK